MRSVDLTDVSIPYDSGEKRFVFSCYLSFDKIEWIHHGTFCEFYRSGQLAAQGTFVDGLQDGQWIEFHENGQVAFEGTYDTGSLRRYSKRFLENGDQIQ